MSLSNGGVEFVHSTQKIQLGLGIIGAVRTPPTMAYKGILSIGH